MLMAYRRNEWNDEHAREKAMRTEKMMSTKLKAPTRLTAEVFDSLSDAEKEAIYNECERVDANEGTALSPTMEARWRRAVAKAGRPKIGKGAARVQITVERGLLKKADDFAKCHKL
jgi:hypothetical protein